MSITPQSNFVYVTFIRTTPERLWSALISADFMKEYWFGMHLKTEWKVGAQWQMVFPDGRIANSGEIVELESQKRLVLKWHSEHKPEWKAEGDSFCGMELEPVGDAVKLTITHTMDRPESKLIQAASGSWPRILSNLKSLLETGQVALKA